MSQYLEGFGQFDLNLGYDFNPNIASGLQVINLSKAKQERDFGDENRPIGLFHFGRRILAGVQMKL